MAGRKYPDSNTCNQASIAFLRSLGELVLDTDVDQYIHTLHFPQSLFKTLILEP